MKKQSMSLIEIIIGISLMTILAAISINVMHSLTSKDTDIIKFKHVYATVSEVIYELKNDASMYPAGGFANLQERSYTGEVKKYGGAAKFSRLFKSKFNIFKNDVKISFSTDIPYILVYNKTDKKDKYITKKELNCFLDNKGVLYCPPVTSFTNKEKLLSIYIPVYINKIKISSDSIVSTNNRSTGLDKAIFFEIEKNGKINIPTVISNNDKYIINCYDSNYNEYNHCKAIEKMQDFDF